MPHKKDNRFAIAHREAITGCVLALINILWWYGFAYGFGSKNPEEYAFILGFPAWFFWSCIIGVIVMIALVFLVVKFVLQDVPFDDVDEEVGPK